MSGQPSQRELEIQNAKAQLLSSGTYDIMVKVIRKILDERPSNAADQLGDIFEKVQLEACPGEDNLSALQQPPEKSSETCVAEIQKRLFEQSGGADGEINEEEDDSAISILPDMQELLYFFEQGGVGLGREEWIRVYFALKQLCDPNQSLYPPMASCRFWGKILGLEKNYYVAEVTFRDEEEEEEILDGVDLESLGGGDDDGDDDGIGEKLPSSNYKAPPKIPSEDKSVAGANKHTYYVVNEPGEEWVRLPSVSPSQIVTARSITKFLSGHLKAKVSSFPEFPGEERHLLRAQIARISAGTIIAPMMYYQFDEDEEVDDEEMAQTEFIENTEFDGVPVRDLADESLGAWVHTRLPLLNQGRCIWWNPKQKPEGDEDFDEDDDDADGEEGSDQEQEIGPPLLTPLSEDVEINGSRAWSAHTSSAPGMMHIQHCICVIKSNLWPGATAFSNGRRFENVYIGYGTKYSTDNFSPQACQMFENECKEPEMNEVADPTVDEEHALDAQRAAEQEEAEHEEEEDED